MLLDLTFFFWYLDWKSIFAV